MNGVDATEHYASSTSTASLPPSLLTIVLDTNPYIWSQLHDTLPLSAAVANLLVFINAHLACNYSNRVAVVASHLRHATWLYPTPAEVTSPDDADGDQEASDQDDKDDSVKPATVHKYKYRPFADIEAQISRNLKRLLRHTPTRDDSSSSASSSTMMAGALTLALSYINRETIAYAEANGTARPDDPSNTSGAATTGLDTSAASAAANTASTSAGLQSRILIISVTPSSADAAHQYIPLMNTIFASQRLRIPLDVAVLNGNPVFLQQAADATGGVYMALTDPPEARNGFLEYLLLAFLPDATLRRRNLRTPAQVDVDFRAACFCHRKVVDVGWVCSVCLSIFCEPPPPPPTQQEGSGSMRESVVEGSGTPSRKRQRESTGGTAAPARSLSSVCLTCGTELSLQTENTGIKPPALLPRRGKKKRKLDGGAGGQRSGTATPRPVKTEQ